MNSVELLLEQVDAFIKKYYKNLMLKGVLLFIIIFLVSFLIVAGLEYIGRFNSLIRGVLLFSFIAVNAYVLIRYFIVPLTKLFSFGKRIDRYQAAEIIGSFFPEINDKLLNTLQLRDEEIGAQQNIELLRASVKQNASKLSSFQFATAVDYSENRRYFKYVVPVILSFVIIGLVLPNLFTDSSERLLNYNQTFIEDPDFTFNLLNESLQVEEGSTLTIQVKVEPKPGKSIPNTLFVNSSLGRFAMNKLAKNKAEYKFENLSEDIQFRFEGKGNKSEFYTVEVVKRTSLGQLWATIEYPDYLEMKDEKIENPGDLVLPEGTSVSWDGLVKNTKSMSVIFGDSITYFENMGFRYTRQFYSGGELMFVLRNREINKSDSTYYLINVIKDQYPTIAVNQVKDTLSTNKIMISGNIADDYGISRLVMRYEIHKNEGETVNKSLEVPRITGKESPFSMVLDIDRFALELEEKISYYFIVYDNDGVNGAKSTRSSVFEYRAPSSEELKESRNETKKEVQKGMEEVIQQVKDFNEKISRLKKEMMNSKSNSWQQSKQMENLQKERESLEERMKSLKEKMKSSFEEKNKFSEFDEELLEKQKQLEELMDQVMDEELEKLLDELEKLLEQNDNSEVLEKLENSEMTAEKMKRQMDRTMDMLKKMDVMERADDLIKDLQELANDQEELKDENEARQKSTDELEEEQNKLNDLFEERKNELEDLLEKNQDLARPMDLDSLSKEADETSEEMEKAKENLGDKKRKSAAESQNNAAKNMKKMAQQMQSQMQKSQQQQQGEDIEAMRALLENLISLSFSQERNMNAFSDVNIYDPIYESLGREQREIIDNAKPVKDSLRALADRVPKISSFIEQELTDIEKNFKYIPNHVGEREKRALRTKQQMVMTNINNLALFMNETLQQAQREMNNMMQGSGTCSKPSSKPGKGSSGDIQGMKEMLKKQLEQLKKGGSPGGKKPGRNNGDGQEGGILPVNAKGAAQMAAEQGELRRRLQEMKEEMNKDGSGSGNQLNPLLKELEEQQEQLINKDWDIDLIERQKRIMTRLLESEKAIMERGFEDERKSNDGKIKEKGNQIDFIEYKRQKQKQTELLRTLDPSFSRYYREKANAYFRELN
jgi:hypothetical protein